MSHIRKNNSVDKYDNNEEHWGVMKDWLKKQVLKIKLYKENKIMGLGQLCSQREKTLILKSSDKY